MTPTSSCYLHIIYTQYWSHEPQASILGSSNCLLCGFRDVKATILLSLSLKQIFPLFLYFIPGGLKGLAIQRQTLLHLLMLYFDSQSRQQTSNEYVWFRSQIWRYTGQRLGATADVWVWLLIPTHLTCRVVCWCKNTLSRDFEAGQESGGSHWVHPKHLLNRLYRLQRTFIILVTFYILLFSAWILFFV